jgi:hypothetical protein
MKFAKITTFPIFITLTLFSYGQRIDQKALLGKWIVTNSSDTSVFKEYWEFKGDTLIFTTEERKFLNLVTSTTTKASNVVSYIKKIEKSPYSIIDQSIKFYRNGNKGFLDIKELTEEKIHGQISIYDSKKQ